ncbi:MAG TPA: TetR family transcriptional regulator, partial [Burkholderiales bacterium]|nr:TetR family transcriptional regulator [Burkholderiales bacterium]
MTKALERREKLRAALILAAERMIASRGLAGLKTRDLAREIGCANGAVYNLVADVDELVLRVGSRTLRRLDGALSAAESEGEPSPQETLVRIAIAYCDFAAENLQLWRALFEHRMETDKALPDWSVDDQLQLFRHIYKPLAALLPKRGAEELGITARSL